MKTIHLYLSLFHILLIATRIVVGADLAQSWIDSGTWRVYVGHSKKIRQDTSGNNFILQMIHSFFFLLLFERCTKSAENMSLDYRHPWSLDLSNFPPRKTEFSNIFFWEKVRCLLRGEMTTFTNLSCRFISTSHEEDEVGRNPRKFSMKAAWSWHLLSGPRKLVIRMRSSKTRLFWH